MTVCFVLRLFSLSLGLLSCHVADTEQEKKVPHPPQVRSECFSHRLPLVPCSGSRTDALPAWLQLARITLNPHTLAFFLISVIHCVAQGLTAAFIYSEDASSFKFVDDVVHTADVPDNEVARLFRVGNNLDLRLCTAIPLGTVFKDCETVYTTDPNTNFNVSWALVERFLADVEEPRSSVRGCILLRCLLAYEDGAVLWGGRSLFGARPTIRRWSQSGMGMGMW